MEGIGTQARRLRGALAALLLVALCLFRIGMSVPSAATVSFAAPAFGAAWSPLDEPVTTGAVRRAFIWGAGPSSAGLSEPYREAPGGARRVQYFDKARMELTDPTTGVVTTGLLTHELVTGRIQLGDNPAAAEVRAHGSGVSIVGDAANTYPTYAQLRDRIDRPQPDGTGQPVTELLAPTADGTLAPQPGGMARAADDPNARLAHFVPETGQTIPQGFWAFLNAGGAALDHGALADRTPLFDWVAVVGYPIAPAFWVQARVGGAPTDVMVQLFERRVLTYTPANPDGFTVEMGNIGAHYFQFRYLSPDAALLPATAPPIPPTTAKPLKPTVTPRPTAAPTITGAGPVRIASIVARPPGGTADVNGETVTIRNDGLTTADLTRWTLVDSSGKNVFTFPAFMLAPGGIAVVHSGRGSPGGADLYWGKAVGIWKDHGETATLRDASGAVISTYTYP